ncbi:MAG TPA: D-alanine--D-alanine ligase [Polyangiaceae bacterium]|jgi:D-alanine-D-alanine ligase|nr:D-alanine--D-alanine ligase [Polyangiaceae bacterium]
MSAPKIGVLIGGSAHVDHDSDAGDALVAALLEAGRDAVPVVLGPGIDTVQALRAARIDTALLALSGRLGEEGCVQGVLEVLGIPYTGSSVMSSALAMDKLKSKELFRLHNVPTPPYYTVDGPAALAQIAEIHGSFGFPVVVKPRREGSSVGVGRADSLGELVASLESAMAHDESVVVERFIAAREVHVAMLNGRVLGGVEVTRGTEARSASTTEFSPIRYRGILNLAERAAQALDASGPVRIDVLVTEGQNEYVLDVNTLPSLAPSALLPKMAAAVGFCFSELCVEIIDAARLHTAFASNRPSRVARIPEGARTTVASETEIRVA